MVICAGGTFKDMQLLSLSRRTLFSQMQIGVLMMAVCSITVSCPWNKIGGPSVKFTRAKDRSPFGSHNVSPLTCFFLLTPEASIHHHGFFEWAVITSPFTLVYSSRLASSALVCVIYLPPSTSSSSSSYARRIRDSNATGSWGLNENLPMRNPDGIALRISPIPKKWHCIEDFIINQQINIHQNRIINSSQLPNKNVVTINYL